MTADMTTPELHPAECQRHRHVPPQWDGPGYFVPPKLVRCNSHPDAPHSFDRNASHNAGRYVCECEGWIEMLILPVREASYEVTKGAETVHRHTEPTAPRWPLTVATDGERNGRLAWVPGI